MRDIEKIIQSVDGSMRIEHMTLTEEDKNRIRNTHGEHELIEREIMTLLSSCKKSIINE